MAAVQRIPRGPRHVPPATVETVGGVVRLALAAMTCWVTPPFDWWREAVTQGWLLVRRCAIPTALSCFVFGFGTAGIQAGSLVDAIGALDRMGAGFSVASLREFVPWVAGMVVAGVAGTAIAADLGARRVREELDAIAVLGVDPVRSLVAPRILALTLLMPALNIMGLVFATLAGVVADAKFNGNLPAFMETFRSGFTRIDLAANIVKTVCFGFIVSTICAYKGMNASGGSEGVGRAVNQAVVLAFVAVWVFNFAFNAAYLASFPGALDVR
jgi:phospholipid/cholesterol/gamma-HCH transport system permease protein